MALQLEQTQQISWRQLQSIRVLQMNQLELDTYLQQQAQENPMIDPDSIEFSAPMELSEEKGFLQRMRWLEDNDVQNRFFHSNNDDDESDPLARIGTPGGLELSLSRFLHFQIDALYPKPDYTQLMYILASNLDENGYLRTPLEDLASQYSIPLLQFEEALRELQKLDPSGVGARDLAECLSLQLERQGETGTALTIARHHLTDLALSHYHRIATQLGIAPAVVKEAKERIQALDPRPGSIFASTSSTAFVVPDLIVLKDGEHYVVRMREGVRAPFKFSSYYADLLKETDDPEVRRYLSEKLLQAQDILFVVEHRRSTLLRCAKFLVERQERFLLEGEQALLPLTLADVAAELGLHESTVSRALNGKYIQCIGGVYPLNVFLSRQASSHPEQGEVSSKAARAMLREIIDAEDKLHPLSDQKLSEKLKQLGCTLSRRTVAQYRQEMNIPSAVGRKE